MDLGWLDVCLRVEDVRATREFYEGLGFRRVEGEDSEGWAVMVHGEARLGLFAAQHIRDAFSLNFRGADVGANVERLKAEGYAFESISTNPDGSGSAELRDPDGRLIFLDAMPGEKKKV